MSVNLNDYKDLEDQFGLFAEIQGTNYTNDLSEYDDLEKEFGLFEEIRKTYSIKNPEEEALQEEIDEINQCQFKIENFAMDFEKELEEEIAIFNEKKIIPLKKDTSRNGLKILITISVAVIGIGIKILI